MATGGAAGHAQDEEISQSRRRELLLVAAATLIWAVLDVRELVHQIDESRTGIAAIAGGVAALHLLAAKIAVRLAHDERPEAAVHASPV